MRFIYLLITLLAFFAVQCTTCGTHEHVTSSSISGDTCSCDTGYSTHPWSNNQCVNTIPPNPYDVYYSYSGVAVYIDLYVSANSFDTSKISLREGGITGSSIGFTFSGTTPTKNYTLTPNVTLNYGTTYYVIFHDGAFTNTDGRSQKAVFSFTK